MSYRTPKDVVITGMGIVSPCGIGRQAFWTGLQAEQTCLSLNTSVSLPELSTVYFGAVSEWRAEDYVPRKLLRQTDRYTHFAFAAAKLALQDAQILLEDEDSSRIGTVIASTLGGMEFAERELTALWQHGPRSVSAYQAIAWFYAASQGQISIYHHLHGYSKSLVSDRSGGVQAIGHAYQAIQAGRADILLAGGAEAPLTPFSMLTYISEGMVNTQATSPQNAYVPFAHDAHGLSIGEGAALLVLEEYEHARRRGAPILARVDGYATNCNAHVPKEDYQRHGQSLAQAIKQCLTTEKNAEPAVDYIHADGAASYESDMAEVESLKLFLGHDAYRVPVSVPKARIGDAIGAGGAFATAATVLSLQAQRLLPTPFLQANQLIADLNFVLEQPQQAVIQKALVLARSTMGINAVLSLAYPSL